MPLGIYPTVDYVFKRLFGSPENADLLIHLLNAVLQPAVPIVEVEIQNPFLEKEFEEDKYSVLDILAVDDSGRKFNVEMQTTIPFGLPSRLLYYACQLYGAQLQSGEGYADLVPVFSICFLSKSLFPEIPSPHLKFLLADLQQRQCLTDQLQIHTVELDKYNYEQMQLLHADALERWSFFLQKAAAFEAEELREMLPEGPYRKATGIVEMISHSPEQRRLHEARLRAQRDQATLVDYAQRSEQIGMEKGLEKGLKEGLIGQVRLLERLLNLPSLDAQELKARDNATLQMLISELAAKLDQPKAP